MATFNGDPVTTCRVHTPAYGLTWAEVECANTDTATGPAVLVVGSRTLTGTIMTGGPYNTRSRYRVVAGRGGWGKEISARSYANDAGVKLALVLRDAALECGEVLGPVDPSATVGPAFVRAAGPASRVLHALCPRGWYVDDLGVTQVGRRLRAPYLGEASRLVNDAGQSRYEIAPDDTTLPALVPGAVVDGVEAVDSELAIDDSGAVRVTLWGKGIADTSRAPEAWRRIVETFTAGARFFAPWEYRIVSQASGYVDLQIVRVSSGMPDLRHVPACPSSTYLDSAPPVVPAIGSTCVVSFLNGDPSRPQIMARAGDAVLVGASGIAAAGIVMGGTGSVPTKALVGKIGIGA